MNKKQNRKHKQTNQFQYQYLRDNLEHTIGMLVLNSEYFESGLESDSFLDYAPSRDRVATLRLEGGTISESILGGGGTRHFFLLTLYNLRNIWGHVLPRPSTPRSLPIKIYKILN